MYEPDLVSWGAVPKVVDWYLNPARDIDRVLLLISKAVSGPLISTKLSHKRNLTVLDLRVTQSLQKSLIKVATLIKWSGGLPKIMVLETLIKWSGI